MPKVDYASKGPLQTPMPKGDMPQKSKPQRDYALETYASKGPWPEKSIPFYCTNDFSLFSH